MNRSGLSSLRMGAALGLIFCWLIATNHCGLAVMLRASAPGVGHCGHCGPEKGPCDHGALPCCQALKASLPGGARAPSLGEKEREVLPPVEIARGFIGAAGEIKGRLRSREHAPPTGGFFIQVVLRSALPAHGPPMRIA